MEYSNIELWEMAEAGIIDEGTVFEDQEGNEVVFTGHSFQVFCTELDQNEWYVGFCVGDMWRIVD